MSFELLIIRLRLSLRVSITLVSLYSWLNSIIPNVATTSDMVSGSMVV